MYENVVVNAEALGDLVSRARSLALCLDERDGGSREAEIDELYSKVFDLK